jgi:ABC-type glycerol-3-phosphate transport system substrate-binding protein
VKLSKIIFVAVLLLLLNRYLPIYQAFIRAGNKVIGIPIEATVNGLFYNKELFKTAGVSVPTDADHIWTWSEFKDTVQRDGP